MWTDLSMTPEPVCARPVINDSGRWTVTPLNECLKPCVSYWLFLDSKLSVTASSGCTVMWLLGVTTEQAGPLLRLCPSGVWTTEQHGGWGLEASLPSKLPPFPWVIQVFPAVTWVGWLRWPSSLCVVWCFRIGALQLSWIIEKKMQSYPGWSQGEKARICPCPRQAPGHTLGTLRNPKFPQSPVRETTGLETL